MVVVTGGTGSFGHAFVRRGLDVGSYDVIRIYSRDEFKQETMRKTFCEHPQYSKLRFLLGDVRDRRRLEMAFEGANVVIHAAALKQVPAGEYSPTEFIETNVTGSANVLLAARRAKVETAILLSTDKACSPSTLYGATKLLAERLFTASNSYRGLLSASTRYGNVFGSRGSVVPLWRDQIKNGCQPTLTHPDATRFHMTQENAVDLVLLALSKARGGEVFIPRLRSYRMLDLLEVTTPTYKSYVTIGLRESEKMHEVLVSRDEMRTAVNQGSHVQLIPEITPWIGEVQSVARWNDGFGEYSSKDVVMSRDELAATLFASADH